MVSKNSSRANFSGRMKANIVLFLAGKFVSLFGSFVYSFAIGLFVLKETGSGLSFATTLLFSTAPRVLLGPIAGVIADKVDRKKMVVITDFLSGLVVLALWLAFSLDTFRLSYIYLASVLLSVCNTFFAVAMDASVPNLVDDSYLMKINSLSSGVSSITNIVTPIIGGLVYGIVNINFFLIINGLTFILSAISEMFIDFNYNVAAKEGEQKEGKKFFQELQEGFLYLRNQKVVMHLFALAIAINFFFALGFSVPFPYLLNNVLGVSASQYGIINGLFPAGVLLGSLYLSLRSEKPKKHGLILGGIMIISLTLLLMGLAGVPWVMEAFSLNTIFLYLLALMFVAGFSTPLINTPLMVMMQRRTPDELRGRVLGLMSTTAQAITPIGFIIAGLLIEKVPTYLMIIIPGAFVVLLSIFIGFNKTLKTI